MARLSKVLRSNDAHNRLMHKYDSDVSVMGATKWYYHKEVGAIQHKRGKILSRKERRGIFRGLLASAKKGKIK